MKNIIVFLSFYLVSYSFFSQVNSDRPDQTESSIVLDAGMIQIESGFSFEKEKPGIDGKLMVLNNLIRIGILKDFELRFNTNTVKDFTDNEESKKFVFSDLEIGLKAQILNNESKNTKVAFLTHYSIPSSTIYNSENSALLSRILVSHNLNKDYQIGYNIGYNNYFNLDYDELIYTFAFSRSFKKFALFYEVFGTESNNVSDINWDIGITYELYKNIQIDFAKGKGFNNDLNYYTFGICWLFY